MLLHFSINVECCLTTFAGETTRANQVGASRRVLTFTGETLQLLPTSGQRRATTFAGETPTPNQVSASRRVPTFTGETRQTLPPGASSLGENTSKDFHRRKSHLVARAWL